MARIVVGISGGVDSSVAAHLLKEQGHEVIGLFMINWHDTTGTLEGDCAWHDDRVFAELTAKKLDIALHVVDLSEHYRKRVVEYMFSEYERGRTPNPDVLCNREIKFDVFLEEALKLGAEFVATGHYCRKAEERGEDGETIYKLLAGADKAKDQSYFLCQLSQSQLSKALFPIGDLVKSEVREIAQREGLATAKRKDSQGICFVGKVDLPVFLQQKLSKKEGNIHEIKSDWAKFANYPTDDSDLLKLATPYNFTVRDGKKIGTHSGAHFYTIGQRKGLGIGGRKESLYILATDVESNVIYVGEGDSHPGLYRRALRILPEDMHYVNPTYAQDINRSNAQEVNNAYAQEQKLSSRFMVRIRYRQALQAATFTVQADGCYILFDEPQRGIAAGQFAALYDGEELVASGVIWA